MPSGLTLETIFSQDLPGRPVRPQSLPKDREIMRRPGGRGLLEVTVRAGGGTVAEVIRAYAGADGERENAKRLGEESLELALQIMRESKPIVEGRFGGTTKFYEAASSFIINGEPSDLSSGLYTVRTSVRRFDRNAKKEEHTPIVFYPIKHVDNFSNPGEPDKVVYRHVPLGKNPPYFSYATTTNPNARIHSLSPVVNILHKEAHRVDGRFFPNPDGCKYFSQLPPDEFGDLYGVLKVLMVFVRDGRGVNFVSPRE